MRSSARRLSVKDLTVFAVFGALMFATRFTMQGIPGVHLLGLIIASFTIVYRARSLILLYLYVMLEGVFAGFSAWWVPYLYVWLPLWGLFMAAGSFRLSVKLRLPLYCFLCGFHGLCFGVLYAPFQAFMFGLSFKSMLAWIAAGLPFDIMHAVSNMFMGLLIIPLSDLLARLRRGPQ